MNISTKIVTTNIKDIINYNVYDFYKSTIKRPAWTFSLRIIMNYYPHHLSNIWISWSLKMIIIWKSTNVMVSKTCLTNYFEIFGYVYRIVWSRAVYLIHLKYSNLWFKVSFFKEFDKWKKMYPTHIRPSIGVLDTHGHRYLYVVMWPRVESMNEFMIQHQ